MKEKKSGIYVIERIETGQKYVGQSENVKDRMWSDHKGCKYIYRAIKKYGDGAFKRCGIEYCSIDSLDSKEQFWIKELHSHESENGYNISWGGDASMRGRHPSAETKKKMSILMTGRHSSDETKEKISEAMKGENNPNYGKHLHHSNKTKEKISLAMSGKNHPNWGIHFSDETRKKQSMAKKDKRSSAFAKKHPNASSMFFGVSIKSKKDKSIQWRVSITYNKKYKQIGIFKAEIEAARAYDKYIIENNIDHPLNFPEDYGRSE